MRTGSTARVSSQVSPTIVKSQVDSALDGMGDLMDELQPQARR